MNEMAIADLGERQAIGPIHPAQNCSLRFSDLLSERLSVGILFIYEVEGRRHRGSLREDPRYLKQTLSEKNW
jgi:hypothetical protein